MSYDAYDAYGAFKWAGTYGRFRPVLGAAIRTRVPTFEHAERLARNACKRLGEPVTIVGWMGKSAIPLAVCRMDALDRVWTDLDETGAKLV